LDDTAPLTEALPVSDEDCASARTDTPLDVVAGVHVPVQLPEPVDSSSMGGSPLVKLTITLPELIWSPQLSTTLSIGQGPEASDLFDSPTGSARYLLAREDEPLDVLSFSLFRHGAIGFDLCLASKSQPIKTRADGRLVEEEGALHWHPPENYAL
jgi:hypothetical protein